MKWISIPYEEKLMLFPHSTYCSEGVADFDSLFKFVEGVTLGRESQCICGTKVKAAWDAAHSGSQTSQCNQV